MDDPSIDIPVLLLSSYSCDIEDQLNSDIFINFTTTTNSESIPQKKDSDENCTLPKVSEVSKSNNPKFSIKNYLRTFAYSQRR